MKLRMLSTAALAACSLVLSGAIPASAAAPTGASPSSGALSAAGAVTGDGFVRSLGAASALVPRATGYDAVDPVQGYGTITGRVTVPAGVALSYAYVTLTDGAGNRVDDAYVRDGLFGVTSLDAGTYTLTVEGESTVGQGLAGGPVQATVTLGMLTSGVEIPLTAGAPSSFGTIEGTITGPGGTALPAGTWGDIDAFDSSGDWAGDGDLGEGGTFQVRGLDPGAYRLRIVVDGFADEWWQDKASLGTATPVTVTAGAVTSINPQVDVGGAIAGTVTGPGGITLPDGFWVRAYDEDGDERRLGLRIRHHVPDRRAGRGQLHTPVRHQRRGLRDGVVEQRRVQRSGGTGHGDRWTDGRRYERRTGCAPDPRRQDHWDDRWPRWCAVDGWDGGGRCPV